MTSAIHEPTIRKIRNRGYVPIRYRMENASQTYSEVRHGWEIERTEKHIVVQLVGDDHKRRLPLSEGRYIEVLP